MIDDKFLIGLFNQVYTQSNLPLRQRHAGKVRDWYSLGENKRLMITTDRLSAFDRILSAVPFKGQVLNQLSAWWFRATDDILPNHMILLPDPNGMVVHEVQPLPIEVIVRGYITGVTKTALWYRYSLGERKIYGYEFDDGLRKNQSLDKAIITPTTKGGLTGQDERLTCNEVVEKGFLDEETWEEVQKRALALFDFGQQRAIQAGLLLVDTKYEFGKTKDGRILLIDEVHTPDSSRFWKADTYQKSFDQDLEPENFDKEFIRQAYASMGYRGDGEPPVMPQSLWVAAAHRYITIYEMLTGTPFIFGEYPVEARLVENLERSGIL